AKYVEHRRAHDRRRSVEVARALRRRASEVDHGFASSAIDRDAHLDALAAVELDVERAVMQAVDGRAHAFGGVPLHVPHVAGDGARAEALRQTLELEHPAGIRG